MNSPPVDRLAEEDLGKRPDNAERAPGRPVSEQDVNEALATAAIQVALDQAGESVATARTLLPGARARAEVTDALLGAAIRSVPRWHFAMLNDLERNDAFAVALERVVPRGAHVLDIGSGTGLLAMMAVKAGAGAVTTCEVNPVLAAVAEQIIAAHGLSDRITVVPKLSTDLVVGVDLPRRADVVVSEIVDCGLVGEGVLPTVRHAREHLLEPGGVLLPESAVLYGALLDSQAVDGLNRVQSAAGLDVRLLNALATRGHFPVRLPTWPHRLLSASTEIAGFDFATGALTDEKVVVDFEVTEPGTAHGLAVWFELRLGGGIALRNAPDNLASHWMQAFVPFAEPVGHAAGARLRIVFSWTGGRLSARQLDFVRAAEGIS
ncbi:50S ribosomal protein L11 methyltransferase [Actinokineospora globicatena]|uniref:50S ribosomal protein L11 methyltransferase n=1 Tax=Actinokineospora globicatena TaxID=103729 RepID=UPI0020A2F2A1|nr:50S ribosomal protein L11 methyltransferase [Actinokineospora globicatena]MCP2305889.1 Ribosomal protein L11 methyltransferase (PrmA) [Actinokineospora globicatena]